MWDLKVIEARALFSALPADDRCSPGCPGWVVFNEGTARPELRICEPCWYARPLRVPTNDQVALLREAQWLLEATRAKAAAEDVKLILWPPPENLDDEDADELLEGEVPEDEPWSPDTAQAVGDAMIRHGFGPPPLVAP